MLREFSDRYPPDPPPSRWSKGLYFVLFVVAITLFLAPIFDLLTPG